MIDLFSDMNMGENVLLPTCHLDMHSFKTIHHLFNNIQLLEKSFNTEEQCQNMNFNKPIDHNICYYLNHPYGFKR